MGAAIVKAKAKQLSQLAPNPTVIVSGTLPCGEMFLRMFALGTIAVMMLLSRFPGHVLTNQK